MKEVKTRVNNKISREQMLLINLIRALNEASEEIATGLQFGLDSRNNRTNRSSKEVIEKKLFNIATLVLMLEQENVLSSDWYSKDMFAQEIKHIEKLLHVSFKKQIMSSY